MATVLSLDSAPPWATISPTGLLTVAPSAPLGANVLTVRATDGATTATKQVTVNVVPIDPQPIATLAKPVKLGLSLTMECERRDPELRLAESELVLDFDCTSSLNVLLSLGFELTSGARVVSEADKLRQAFELSFSTTSTVPTFVQAYLVAVEGTDFYPLSGSPSSAEFTDNNWTTGFVCTSPTASPQCEILAEFSSPRTISEVRVAGGTVPDFGNVASILNGAQLQWSSNGTAWNTVATVSGATDTTGDYVSIPLASSVTASFWRLRRANAVGTTMLMFMF